MSGGGKAADITATTPPVYGVYTSTTDTHGRLRQQAGVSGSLLEDNSLGYSVQQGYGNRGDGANGSVSLSYQGGYANSNMGYNYSRGARQLNYGLSGGIVIHEEGLTLSQPLSDTNVLIAAPGTRHARVENTTGVRTDRKGYTVLPYATTYRQNRIALDVNSLDNATEIDDPVTRVVPTKGALVKAQFTVQRGARAMITLQQYNGRPVPFGAMVTRANAGSGIVNESGQVYLSGLEGAGALTVMWGTAPDQQCTVRYRLPAGAEQKPINHIKAACQ
ncbi:fimbria/pilus outer membrane usher protein [Shimwellia blattae]|uniref:fimbria/pilus outer membrane usher protein n=1 Tax=Shimwellia blattae TaxID=563 RepID=UPI001E619D74|nr:fimbria/pilus outer membrane usher protein [Shimwellia blattae]